MSKLSKVHLDNLSKLASYLKYKVKAKQFDIGSFRRNDAGRVLTFRTKDDCGTVGCALGWAPFVIDAKFSDFVNYGASNQFLSFYLYSNRVFGVKDTDLIFKYMFDYNWANIKSEKTKTATIRRILEVVKSKGKLTKSMKSKIKLNLPNSF